MNRQDVLRIVDDAVQAAYEAGPTDGDVEIDPYVDRILALDGRTWIGEALAAFDQAVTEAGSRDGFPSPDFWVSRAQAAAAIASAEQAKVANLLAWKQLQIAREKQGVEAFSGGSDAIDEMIERALGIGP